MQECSIKNGSGFVQRQREQSQQRQHRRRRWPPTLEGTAVRSRTCKWIILVAYNRGKIKLQQRLPVIPSHLAAETNSLALVWESSGDIQQVPVMSASPAHWFVQMKNVTICGDKTIKSIKKELLDDQQLAVDWSCVNHRWQSRPSFLFYSLFPSWTRQMFVNVRKKKLRNSVGELKEKKKS